MLVLGLSGFTLNLHILVTASEYDTRPGDGGTDVHDAYKSCVSIGWMDIWCNLGHYMDSCALQWCMLLACTLQVYTHTHTQSQTHTFFFLFWSFRSYKHIETRSPRVCELYVPGPEERLYRCGFWFSLSELSELTHSLICLSGFSFVRLCVCVCVFKRKILHMWGATLRHREHF